MGGISNFQIEDAFKKIGDEDLLENVVGVFPSNYMNKFINHAAMISDKGKYPFIIANTDASNKPGVHWWSILDIEPRNDIFFFDSFSLNGLKHFIIIQDDKPIVDKILLGIEQMNRTDKKITLCKIKFNLSACKELSKKEIDSLCETARNLFLFRSSVRNKIKTSKLCQYLDGWGQNTRPRLCNMQNISNIFLWKVVQSRRKQQNSGCSKVKKGTVEMLFNELFTLDHRENEIKMEEYADKIGVKISV